MTTNHQKVGIEVNPETSRMSNILQTMENKQHNIRTMVYPKVSGLSR
jgi:hypothetical protein